MPSKLSNESYQTLSKQLDEVLADLQDPSITIDDAIFRYETAMKLIGKLEKYLESAENRIQEIKTQFSKEK